MVVMVVLVIVIGHSCHDGLGMVVMMGKGVNDRVTEVMVVIIGHCCHV